MYPSIIETVGKSQRAYDLPTKLLQDRIIYLGDEIDDELANSICMQMLWLSTDNPEENIKLYINSPGGVITAGMAIYDVMNLIPNKVDTVCLGQACSMGAFLLSSGTGTRSATKHARIMIHQPLGGAGGQASDIEIQAKEILRMKEELTRIMANNSKGKTGFDVMTMKCDRDNFMSAEEAVTMGLVDKVL